MSHDEHEGLDPEAALDGDTRRWQVVVDAEAIGEAVAATDSAFARAFEEAAFVGEANPAVTAEVRAYAALESAAAVGAADTGDALGADSAALEVGRRAFARAGVESPAAGATTKAGSGGAGAGMASMFLPEAAGVDTHSPLRVLRIAAITDGELCDELWQTAPGDVQVGHDLANSILLHDSTSRAPDYRRLAPLWLLLGIAIFVAGTGYFVSEVRRHRSEAAEAELKGLQISSFQLDEESVGHGGLAFALALLGLVPLVFGVMGLGDAPRTAPRATRRSRGEQAPGHHTLFAFVGGHYFVDLPPTASGKLLLGKKSVGVAALRKRMAAGTANLRVKLPRNAKGKLILGQTTLLFQMSPPLLPAARGELSSEYIDVFGHFRMSPLERWVLLATALFFVPFFLYASFGEGTDSGPPDERFLKAMELPIALFEEEVEPEAEAEEEVLAVEDEKVEKKEEEEEDDVVLAETPSTFSRAAVEQARGVGIARVLGTYGGPGEGTVFDVIQSTENNLGELFDQGMTQTVMSSGGDITAFVAGGKGISESGSAVQGSGLVTDSEVGAEIGQTEKKEKRVQGRLSSTTSDIYGDVDKKAVQATIRRRMSALQHCYEKALRTQPDLRGKMTYTIAVSTVGRVTNVSVEEDTLGDAGVNSCTVAKIKGWRFPAEGAEEASEVTFSVVFSGAA